jgi:hypothetical protein
MKELDKIDAIKYLHGIYIQNVAENSLQLTLIQSEPGPGWKPRSSR